MTPEREAQLRDAFEREFAHMPLRRGELKPDSYWCPTTACAWEAWKACARALEPKWLPIETAPKDGTQILLSNGSTVAQGWWWHEEPYVREQRDMAGVYIDQQEHDGFDGWMDCEGGMQPDPTHWMPLPEQPKAAMSAALEDGNA